MGQSRHFFLYFRLFNTVNSKQVFNVIFANVWSQTVSLWYWKRLLYQYSHNNCPVGGRFVWYSKLDVGSIIVHEVDSSFLCIKCELIFYWVAAVSFLFTFGLIFKQINHQ